jgi:hypothetical protein
MQFSWQGTQITGLIHYNLQEAEVGEPAGRREIRRLTQCTPDYGVPDRVEAFFRDYACAARDLDGVLAAPGVLGQTAILNACNILGTWTKVNSRPGDT